MKLVLVVLSLMCSVACVACQNDAPTPPLAPKEGPSVSEEPSRTELRDEDLRVTFVDDVKRSLPTTLAADPAGALRPSWQLLKPAFEGELTDKDRSDLNFGFCATFKERRWFARCEGDVPASPARFAWTRHKDGKSWDVVLGGTVKLVDWSGHHAEMVLHSRYKVEDRPKDLSSESWWRNAARALTVDWIARVDTARRSAQTKTMRLHWSEFRRDPPLFKAPQDALWEPIFLQEQAWLATTDAVKGHTLIHHFTKEGVPIAQIIQVAKGSPTRPMLSVDEANKRLLVTSTDFRELDPLKDKHYKLSGNCDGKDLTCYGISVVSFDMQGKTGLRARVPQRRALAPTLALPGEEQLLFAQDAEGKVELIHLLRGGLEKARHAMSGVTAPNTRISASFLEGVAYVGPLVHAGQQGWVALETGRKGAKPVFHKVSAAEPSSGRLLVPDGAGGALMLTRNKDAWTLHRHKGKGGAVWSMAVPQLQGAHSAEVTRVGQRIMVRSVLSTEVRQRKCMMNCGPQGATWFDLGSGAILATWSDRVLSAPVLANESIAVCRQSPGKEPHVEVTRDLKTVVSRHSLPWGCEALQFEGETGDVRAISSWPGGAYFVDMP